MYRLQFCRGKVSALDSESTTSFTDVYEGPSTSHLVTNLEHNVEYSLRVSGQCYSGSGAGVCWSPWSLPVTWATTLPRRGSYFSLCLSVVMILYMMVMIIIIISHFITVLHTMQGGIIHDRNVCLSVYLSNAWTVIKWKKLLPTFLYHHPILRQEEWLEGTTSCTWNFGPNRHYSVFSHCLKQVSDVVSSGSKLFHTRGPATLKARSMTVIQPVIPMEQGKIWPSVILYFFSRSLPNLVRVIVSTILICRPIFGWIWLNVEFLTSRWNITPLWLSVMSLFRLEICAPSPPSPPWKRGQTLFAKPIVKEVGTRTHW